MLGNEELWAKALRIAGNEQFCGKKLIEEMSELTKEIIKLETKPNGRDPQERIDEAGDVYVRLMLYMSKLNQEKLINRINYKLSKLKL